MKTKPIDRLAEYRLYKDYRPTCFDPRGSFLPDRSHWACGWFEIILIKPTKANLETLNTIIERLEDYPVLDEEDLSNREYEEALESWDSWAFKDLMEALKEAFELSETAVDTLERIGKDKWFEKYSDISNCPYETGGDGPSSSYGIKSFVKNIGREEIASAIWYARREENE